MSSFLAIMALFLVATLASAQSGGSSVITSAVTDAISSSGDGILAPMAVLLGILVTVGIGWAIVRTLKG